MFTTLLFLHSLFRWLVLATLLYSIYRAGRGYTKQLAFTAADDAIRHWTATVSHIQLLLGITIYTQSAQVKYFWTSDGVGGAPMFFGLFHIVLMLASVVMITVGSALAKRKSTDRKKFETMLLWFSLALLIILLAIPWPFSPLAARPYLRSF